MIKDEDMKFLEKLEEYPHLRKRFEEILNVAESDDIITADEAEEKAIEETRKLGQEMLYGWAVKQHKKQIHKVIDSHPEAKRQGKKNSTGDRHLEK
jgi:cell fate (sporulation/competence/biofilm development) regulator YlbF (YheA/YmcA/DUF963 family)